MEIVQPAYDSSAYKVKYRVTFKSQAGYDVQMDVLVKSSAMMIVKKIGEFRSLSLALEGNGAIDDPITKSTLQFSMVDDIYKADGYQVKYGNWQEFFTPDSTAYLVVLRTDEGQGYVARWSGYVTPDSWEEDLGAYGDIRVTARDNIGHLADFEFDMNGGESGTVTVRSLLKAAMAKVSMPMSLVLNTDSVGEAMGVYGGDMNILDASVNVAAFEGRSWYDAVSSVLGSLGLTMRYTDNNAVTVMPLANLPLLADTQSLTPYFVQFLDGTRMLDPAYKEVVSETDYGVQDEIEQDLQIGLEYGASEIYTWGFTSTQGSIFDRTGTGQITPITGSREQGWQNGSKLFSPLPQYGDAENSEGPEVAGYPLLAANSSVGSTYAAYRVKVGTSALKVSIKFGLPLTARDGYMTPAYLGELETEVALILHSSGTDRYWNGQRWVTDVVTNTFRGDEIEIDTIADSASADAFLTIAFDMVRYTGDTGVFIVSGVYARLLSITLAATMQMLESDKVRTVNNEAYNVKADRVLEIGALSKEVAYVTPQSYLNALWDMTTQGEVAQFPYYCFLESGFYLGRKEFPLPVLIHRQMLMFHHEAQPILSGECATSDGRALGFGRLYRYKGVDHIIQGGTLNLRTGRMEGVTLRGFTEYEDLWQ